MSVDGKNNVPLYDFEWFGIEASKVPKGLIVRRRLTDDGEYGPPSSFDVTSHGLTKESPVAGKFYLVLFELYDCLTFYVPVKHVGVEGGKFVARFPCNIAVSVYGEALEEWPCGHVVRASTDYDVFLACPNHDFVFQVDDCLEILL